MADRYRRLADAVQGDVNDVRHIVLDGGDLDDTDLVGATVEGLVKRASDPSPTTLSGSVVDAARHIIEINLGGPGGWLATAPLDDDWLMRYRVTFGDGRVWTWPSGPADRLRVNAP